MAEVGEPPGYCSGGNSGKVAPGPIPPLLGADPQKTTGPGRPRVDIEVRRLIKQMALDGWSALRIDSELMKLGFVVPEATVSRYLPRSPVKPNQVKRWLAFLHNHNGAVAAMDFFTAPPASLLLLVEVI